MGALVALPAVMPVAITVVMAVDNPIVGLLGEPALPPPPEPPPELVLGAANFSSGWFVNGMAMSPSSGYPDGVIDGWIVVGGAYVLDPSYNSRFHGPLTPLTIGETYEYQITCNIATADSFELYIGESGDTQTIPLSGTGPWVGTFVATHAHEYVGIDVLGVGGQMRFTQISIKLHVAQ